MPTAPVISLTSPSIANNSTYTTSNKELTIQGSCKGLTMPCSSVTGVAMGNTASVSHQPNMDTFTISFTAALTGTTNVALTGKTSDGQSTTFTFVIIYDDMSMGSATDPEINSPIKSDGAPYTAFEEVEDTVILRCSLDPNAKSTLTLEYRDTDIENQWEEKETLPDVTGEANFTWTINTIEWKPGSYRLTVMTEGAMASDVVEFSIFELPDLYLDGVRYQPGETRTTANINFTLSGKDSVEGGIVTVRVKDSDTTLGTTTVNNEGEWSINIKSPGTGDQNFEVDITTTDGFILEQDDDIELSITNEMVCVGPRCKEPNYTPAEINESLCSTSAVPSTPTLPGAALLFMLLGVWVVRRRT